ncbi:DNA polymerase/3'-5' exonuclease PolX [Sphingobacterium faecium]|uniref:DNA polymerase/3'-5' exonuclease PolX n=1 Tax=Sphingobacterium faecium TaxID=34087 RepID=UPI00246978FD|nr:DNA polymerase/3'-5' exonuclease PolX [Sphingobacterium faecium]MDH5826060.1 helix-hairpin-helix domain-containing protein [Sphingobacterium faecium]
MDNKTIAKKFKLCSQLMELHNENPFRTKAIASASFKLDKVPFLLETASFEEISSQPGIGKSTAEKVKKLAETGSFDELDAMLSITPEGLLEMLNIKGLGPKKIQIIWNDLQIESVGELLYACNENRLIEAKGFGLKTQEDIKKSIEFSISNEGWFLYAKVLSHAEKLFTKLQKSLSPTLISFTGDFRRKCEVLSSVDILLDADKNSTLTYLNTNYPNSLKEEIEYTALRDENGFSFHIYLTTTGDFHKNLLLTTGSKKHVEGLNHDLITALASEQALYMAQGMDYIEPELREGLNEIILAKAHELPILINFDDLKGTLHNHSTYSDGVHSLAEMARYCKDELGLNYFGICDHSKTAVYANGLSIERVQKQWEEIDLLNQELAPFKIFKGIESDILGDGSLDYPDEVLAGFDFVVASVHSNLKMDEEKATSRLLKAIENPYTTILGHPTGRLLLSRSGYPLDYKKIIDACAVNNVVIEINANPLRLDLDWRWHRYAIEKGVLLAINPDAHRTEGLKDMHYGIFVARKGGLSVKNCLNSFSLSEIEDFFNKKKK